MRKALVIQHVPSEGLGIIGPRLKKAGLEAELIKVYEGHDIPRGPSGYSALIVLGGPMGVYEEDLYPFIRKEIRLIQAALREGTPLLGICLGSQMLAKAAGAPVYKGESKEIGWYDVSLTDDGKADRLFAGMPDKFTVFQWHGDTFGIPSNGRNLASSKLFRNQVIRAGKRAYGVQFHLEVTEEMIREWLDVNREELKPLKGIDPKAIVKEAPENLKVLHRHCDAFISRFLRLTD